MVCIPTIAQPCRQVHLKSIQPISLDEERESSAVSPSVRRVPICEVSPCLHVELLFKMYFNNHSLIVLIKQILVNSVDIDPALLEFISSLTPRGLGSCLPQLAFQFVLGFE